MFEVKHLVLMIILSHHSLDLVVAVPINVSKSETPDEVKAEPNLSNSNPAEFGAPSSDSTQQKTSEQTSLHPPVVKPVMPQPVHSSPYQWMIVGGEEVSPVGRLPWQGSLEAFGGHICGCVLIDSQWVLSAAHCIRTKMQYLTVTLGMHDRRRQQGEPIRYKLDQIIVHPEYQEVPDLGFPNDIALLHLSEPANLQSPYIAVVDLPTEGADFVSAECYITGWGRLNGGGPTSNALQEARTTAMTQEECEEAWGTESLNSGHICVYWRGLHGACNGDSGGPLVCRTESTTRWQLSGVTSWGDEKCLPSMPSVYTRVSHYND